MLNEINTCSECRYYLPTSETFYNKPCGYCGNFTVQRRRISDDKACKLFEQDGEAIREKPT